MPLPLERCTSWSTPASTCTGSPRSHLQNAFAAIWERLALRYRYVPNAALSFNLVNGPPALGLRGFTRDLHEALIRRTIAAVRAVAPGRPLSIDGLAGGSVATPELADLGVTHCTRGCQPMSISHYRASWWPGHQGLAEPRHPAHYDDEQTPDEMARAWIDDLLTVFSNFGWGFALRQFAGPFGIIGHQRPAARFEQRDGFLVDVWLLERMREAHWEAARLENALVASRALAVTERGL